MPQLIQPATVMRVLKLCIVPVAILMFAITYSAEKKEPKLIDTKESSHPAVSALSEGKVGLIISGMT